MLCNECQKKPATVHITKIINGEKAEIHLCEECAKQKQIGFSMGINPFGFDIEQGFSIGKLLSNFFDAPEKAQQLKSDEQKCDRCGLSFPIFAQTGRFGCSNCYNAFEGALNPMLRKIHGKTYHVGKVPRRSGSQIRVRNEIQHLKRELQEAVNAEEYERAAVIRDKIKELEENNENRK